MSLSDFVPDNLANFQLYRAPSDAIEPSESTSGSTSTSVPLATLDDRLL